MKSGYFGGLGGSWDQVWNQGGKKERFRAKVSSILEVILLLFRYFCAGVFSVFSERLPFRPIGRFRSPKVAKREVLGGNFGDILRVGPKRENRCFM